VMTVQEALEWAEEDAAGVLTPQQRYKRCLAAEVRRLQGMITHCENCGGDWVDNGLQSRCYCCEVKRLQERIAMYEANRDSPFKEE